MLHRAFRICQGIPDHSASQLKSSCDYVIVGGGTSGLTVADRLTEDGKTNSPMIDEVTGGMQGFGASYFYDTVSLPQSNLGNRTFSVLAGKVVGGSSAVNAMMTVRGTSEDYDRWGDFFSRSSSWSWKGMLPYFKKGLTFMPPDSDVVKSVNLTYDQTYWGNTSHVYAGWPSFQYPGTVPQINALREIPGVEFPPDSGAGRAGVYWFPTFMDPKKVQRSYARTGHYDGINRTNYDLVADSRVTRILLDDTTATGVIFKQTTLNVTSNYTVRANKEVILAAGAVHTPQLLQLSGIGSRKLLNSARIKTVVDLPGVGQNFQDHPMLSSVIAIILTNYTIHPTSMDLFSNGSFNTWAQQVWASNRTGPYSLGIGNLAGWLPMMVVSPERHKNIAERLESQDHTAMLPPDTHPTIIAGYEAQMKSLAIAIRSNNTAFYSMSISGSSFPATGGVLLHPVSRGTVNINITHPDDTEPIVDYRTLSNPIDIDLIVEMIRFTRRYHFNTSLSAYGPSEISPGSAVVSDEGLAESVRNGITPTEYHPSGTCAMLPLELGGVVDETLRVYGIDGLRVVDASVMPTLPGANTCQTVYAIAEKAADIIKSGE
ncbi:GMC oxidoreductase [Stipitochalara longipes BDJ]|nr:GMC oxidoreductase [Stipitochalara longipes BDJ]